MKYEPMRHQQLGYDWLMSHEHAGLFMDMGLGKTVTTLTVLETRLHDEFSVRKALVIAPKNVAETVWAQETQKWDHLTGIRCQIVTGSAEKRRRALRAQADLYIINRENVLWLMEELGVKVPAMPELANQGKTPLHFANEKGDYLGTVAAADVLKADSQAAVQAMTKMGLDVVMLTGDNEATAKAIARKAGIAHVISDVLPTDKAGAVGKLQAEGHRVLMVGDGINDAPALVSADVGMAIGAGTDIAIESADVVLMTGSLAAVSGAVELSKATIRNIRQNLFWAFFYNTLGIPLAAGVLFLPLGLKLSPMFGAAAMSLSSVFVVTNALRLRLFKPKTSPSVVEVPKHEEIKTKEDTIMKTVIKVNGMMCGHCKAHVETACKGVPGVTDAVVDLDAKNVTVTGDADVAALKKAITDAGYEVVE